MAPQPPSGGQMYPPVDIGPQDGSTSNTGPGQPQQYYPPPMPPPGMQYPAYPPPAHVVGPMGYGYKPFGLAGEPSPAGGYGGYGVPGMSSQGVGPGAYKPSPAAPLHSPQPYGMPSGGSLSGPWTGGGPVGSGMVPADVESQVLYSFAEKAVRHAFVRKVFGILLIQLLVTVGFSVACLTVQPIKTYVRSTPWPFYMAWGLSFGLLIAMSCSERLRRHYPHNMVCLVLFTLCEAFLVGMITSYFNIEAVLMAFITTAAAVAALTLIATQTKLDLTSWGTFLLIPSVVLIALVFIGIFWVNRIVYLVIAGFAALLFSAYLVYDIQLVMGGKMYAISPDEYVFAAINLYLDIVNLFIWILYLFGLMGRSD